MTSMYSHASLNDQGYVLRNASLGDSDIVRMSQSVLTQTLKPDIDLGLLMDESPFGHRFQNREVSSILKICSGK